MNEHSKDIWTDLSAQMAAAAEAASRLVVAHEGRGRFPASGLAWRAGVVVTAAHTVRTDAEIPVTFPDWSAATATVAGIERGTDFAVLRAEKVVARPVRASSSETSRVGDLVLAVGRSRRA